MLKHQAETFLKVSATRRRNPAREATLRAYRSYIENWIVPVLGSEDLANIKNKEAKRLIDRMIEAGLRPRTINAVVNCLKAIVRSAENSDGEQLYPRTWNSDFMDLPNIERGSGASIINQEGLQEALGRADSKDMALYAILAGTGLRVGEVLSLSTSDEPGSSFWDIDNRVIHVRSTTHFWDRSIQNAPKTSAGIRQVDVHPTLNDFLRAAVPANRGLVFSQDGLPVVYSTMLRRAQRNGITEGFHAFRRFRITHLQSESVPAPLIKFWVGHAAADVTETYTKMGRNIEVRRRECERAGLGFQIP